MTAKKFPDSSRNFFEQDHARAFPTTVHLSMNSLPPHPTSRYQNTIFPVFSSKLIPMSPAFSASCLLLLFSVLTSHGDLIPRKPDPGTKPQAPPAPAVPGSAPAPVAAGNLTPDEADKLQKQVELLEKELERTRSGMHLKQLAILKEAMAGNVKAFNFWLDCKEVEDFDLKGKTGQEFADWKRGEVKKNGNNDSFCASIRLQLQFLIVTILDSHAGTPEKEAEVAAAAIAYVEALAAFCEKEENLAKGVISSIMDTGADPNEVVTAQNIQETLTKVREASSALGGDVLNSLYARHLKLDGSVKPRSNATNPGNIDEIYDRLVIQPLRKKKDATAIAAAWMRRIDQTGRVAKSTKVKEIEDKYNAEKVPSMKFAMYRDQWSAGLPKQAAASMIALITAEPTHKDSNDWMQELKRFAASELDKK